MELAQVLAYVFVAFASTYSLHRYYARQLGLSRIKSYIDSRESALQSICEARLQTLKDAAIHLDIDVRKYSEISSAITQQTSKLDDQWKFLCELGKQMDVQSNQYRKYQKDMSFCLQQMRDHLNIFQQGDASYRELEKRSKKVADRVMQMEAMLQEIQQKASADAQEKVYQIIQKSEQKIEEELELCRQGMISRLHQYASDLEKKNAMFEEQTKIAVQDWVLCREKSERIFEESAQQNLERWEGNFQMFQEQEKRAISSLVGEISQEVANTVSHLQQKVGDLQEQFVQIAQKNIFLEQEIELHRTQLKEQSDQSLQNLLDALEDAIAQYKSKLEEQVLSSMERVQMDLVRVQKDSGQLSQDAQRFEVELREKMGSVFVEYKLLLQEFSLHWDQLLQEQVLAKKEFALAEMQQIQDRMQTLAESQLEVQNQICHYQNYLAEKSDQDVKELVTNIQVFLTEKSAQFEVQFAEQFALALRQQRENLGQMEKKLFPLGNVIQVLEDQVQNMQERVQTFSERLHPVLDAQQEGAVQDALQSWQKMTDLLVRERSEELIAPLYEQMRSQVEDLGTNLSVALDSMDTLAKSVRGKLDSSKIVKEFELKLQLQTGSLQEMETRTLELLQEVRKEFLNSEALRKDLRSIFLNEKNAAEVVFCQYRDGYLELVSNSEKKIAALLSSVVGSCDNVEEGVTQLLQAAQQTSLELKKEVDLVRDEIRPQLEKIDTVVGEKIAIVVEEVRNKAMQVMQQIDKDCVDVPQKIQKYIEEIREKLQTKTQEVEMVLHQTQNQIEGQLQNYQTFLVEQKKVAMDGFDQESLLTQKQAEEVRSKAMQVMQQIDKDCVDVPQKIQKYIEEIQNSVEQMQVELRQNSMELFQSAQKNFISLEDEAKSLQLEYQERGHLVLQEKVEDQMQKVILGVHQYVEQRSAALVQAFEQVCADKEVSLLRFYQDSQALVQEKNLLFLQEYQNLQEVAERGFAFLTGLEERFSVVSNKINEHDLVQAVVGSIADRQRELELVQHELGQSVESCLSANVLLQDRQLEVQEKVQNSVEQYQDLVEFSRQCKNSFVVMMQDSQNFLQEKIASISAVSQEILQTIDGRQHASLESIEQLVQHWSNVFTEREIAQERLQQASVSAMEQKVGDLQEQLLRKGDFFLQNIQEKMQNGLQEIETKVDYSLGDLRKEVGGLSQEFVKTSETIMSELDALIAKKGVTFEANLRKNLDSLRGALSTRQSAILTELDQIASKKLKELSQWTSSKSEQVVFKQHEILSQLVSYSEEVRGQLEDSKNNLEQSMNGLVNQFKEDMTERLIYMDETQTKFYADVGEKSALEAQQDVGDFKKQLQGYLQQVQEDVQRATVVLQSPNQLEALLQDFETKIFDAQKHSDVVKEQFETHVQSQLQSVSAYVLQQKQGLLAQSENLIQETASLVQKGFAEQQILWQQQMSELLEQRKKVLQNLGDFSLEQRNELSQIREELQRESRKMVDNQESQYEILSSKLQALAVAHENSLREISGETAATCQSYLEMVQKYEKDLGSSREEYRHWVKRQADELLEKIHLGSDEVLAQISDKMEGVQSNLSQLTESLQKYDQIASQISQIESWENKIVEYENLLQNTQQSLGALEEKHRVFVVMEQEIARLEEQQLGLSRKVDQTMSKQSHIDARFESVEEQSILLESSHKKILEFNEKYSDLEVAINDIEQRRKSLSKLKEDLILESQRLIDLKEKLDDSVRAALKVSSRWEDASLLEESLSDAELDLSPEQFKNTVYTLYRDLKYTPEKIAKVLGKTLKEVQKILKE